LFGHSRAEHKRKERNGREITRYNLKRKRLISAFSMKMLQNALMVFCLCDYVDHSSVHRNNELAESREFWKNLI
jgi:hypothetical protein